MVSKIRKASYKLMNNTVYGKAMENLKGRIEVKLFFEKVDFSNKKSCFKLTSKPSYMSHKTFDNEVALTLIKPAYIGMCILKLSKVLMYEFHYD